jgi:hypothetical protein
MRVPATLKEQTAKDLKIGIVSVYRILKAGITPGMLTTRAIMRHSLRSLSSSSASSILRPRPASSCWQC